MRIISTHAPLAGRDTEHGLRVPALKISTHAPLAGRDRSPCGQGRHSRYFNPRAPCGARPVVYRETGKESIFQPTRPLRGATKLGLMI